MTIQSRHWRHAGRYRTPRPTLDALISQAEMERRINALRLESAPPRCAACGSTTRAALQLVEDKRCPRCKLVLPAYYFRRNRAQKDGLSTWCSACGALDAKDRRSRRALAILGRSA